jgi:hypothetical protein
MSGNIIEPLVTLETKERLAIEPMDKNTHPNEVHKVLAMHNQTIAAANSFHSLFCERHKDGKPADDHYEQDLLRAMLLFACSGLDAAVKQLVRDGLERVIASDPGAQSEFAKFIERRLKKGSADESERSPTQAPIDFTLLATVLASPTPRTALISALVRSLTADSLQSSDQLLKVAAHFALTRDDVLEEHKVTKEAFSARNQVSHEMDIDFSAGDRRRDRAYADMVRWSENILQVGSTFILRVSNKISA